MAWFRKHKQQQPGDVIEARTLRELAETCDAVDQIQAEAPLAIMAGIGGYLLSYIGPIFGAYIAVVNSGGISARSGSTPGTGTVTLQTWNGTALAAMSGPAATWTVYSISSTTGGIPSGTYVIILKIMGAYWLISVDCGN